MKGTGFIRIALIFLIILSLFLTWAIWTMPSQYDEQTNNDQKKTSSVTISRQLSHVFGPSQIVLHEAGMDKLTTNRTALSSFSKFFMTDWQMGNLEDPLEISNENYQNSLAQSDKIELIYLENIPFGVMSDRFSNLPGEYQNRTFDRVYLSISDPDKIYFYNTDSDLLYSSDLEGVDQEKLMAALRKEEAAYQSVMSVKAKNNYIYLPIAPFELPYLTYMVERQPNSLFIERLFDDTSEVKETRSENSVQYIDYISKMFVNEDTNILSYYRNRASDKKMPLTETLRDSFTELMLYENWSDEIHFFDYNSQSNVVTYRRYIDGYPVFGTTDYGATHITVVENGMSELQVPLMVAQTPISDEDNQKELLNGEDLLLYLAEQGYAIEEIEDIQIGYTWSNSSESSRVINLEPDWYIYVNGSWLNSQDLDQDGGDESNGL